MKMLLFLLFYMIFIIKYCVPTTKKEIKLYVEYHNKVRISVNPAASDMKEMVWSNKLFKKAQEIQRLCLDDYKKNGNDNLMYGQNIFKGWYKGNVNPFTPQIAMDGWNEESKYFDYPTSCRKRNGCSQYKQMIWSNTSEIGCYSADCDKNIFMTVCLYFPRGNEPDVPPYQRFPLDSSNNSTILQITYLLSSHVTILTIESIHFLIIIFLGIISSQINDY